MTSGVVFDSTDFNDSNLFYNQQAKGCIHQKSESVMPQKPLQKKLIEDAVFYQYCVKRGLVKDPEPVKTIALSYGVSTSTVQKWEQDPDFDYVKRHDPNDPPDSYGIRSLLEINGEMYRKNSLNKDRV